MPPYSARVSAQGQASVVPPGGLRPGQLGVVLLGRVIVGDVAATLVDLACREIVQVAEDHESGAWLLGASPAAARDRRQRLVGSEPDGLLGHEKALLSGLAADRLVGIEELARNYGKAMARARAALIRDAVRRGWLRRLNRDQRPRQAEELALRIRSFQRELRRLRSEHGESAFNGRLLPFALHFGLVHSGQLPLARFGRVCVRALAELPGWGHTGVRRRRFDGVPSARRSIDEDIMQHRDELWVMSITGGW